MSRADGFGAHEPAWGGIARPTSTSGPAAQTSTPTTSAGSAPSRPLSHGVFCLIDGGNRYQPPSRDVVAKRHLGQVWSLDISFVKTLKCTFYIDIQWSMTLTDMRSTVYMRLTSKTWFYNLPAAKATQFEGNRHLIFGASYLIQELG